MADKKIVMIVDDDSDDRMFFHEAVSQMNSSFEFREAINGEEALRILRSSLKLPDFIFLDLNMPGMDGHQCLKELKKDERLKNLPVIIYSTSSYQVDKDTTRAGGAAYFLTKVSDIKNLPAILKSAMEFVSRSSALH